MEKFQKENLKGRNQKKRKNTPIIASVTQFYQKIEE